MTSETAKQYDAVARRVRAIRRDLRYTMPMARRQALVAELGDLVTKQGQIIRELDIRKVELP